MLKLLAIVVVGILGVMTLKRVMSEVQLQKARVRTEKPRPAKAVTRLRQDERTGIYYPEN